MSDTIVTDVSSWDTNIYPPTGTLTSAKIASWMMQPYSDRTTYLFNNVETIKNSLNKYLPSLYKYSEQGHWYYNVSGVGSSSMTETWNQLINVKKTGMLELKGRVASKWTVQYVNSNRAPSIGYQPTDNLCPTRYHVKLDATLQWWAGALVAERTLSQVCIPLTLVDPLAQSRLYNRENLQTYIRSIASNFDVMSTGTLNVILTQTTSLDAQVVANNAVIVIPQQGDTHIPLASDDLYKSYNVPSISYKIYNTL